MTRLLALLAAFLLCGAVARAEDLPVWRNGTVVPSGDGGFLYMAAKGGFGRAFGLDLQMVPLNADPLLLKALIAGQLDSYVAGPGSPLIAASRGADVRIVGCNWVKQSYTLFGAVGIEGLAGLQGKTVGISSPGSAPDIFIHAALAGAGIPLSSVRFAVVGTAPELLNAMAAGVIVGGAIPDEYLTRATKMGFHVITTSDAATPLSMQRCFYVTAATLKEHPDRVARFLAAEMAAYGYSLGHREETIALTRAVTHAPPDSPEAIGGYDDSVARHVIDPTFQPPMEKLRWLRDILTQFGQMKPGYDPAGTIDLGPLEEARKLVAAAGTTPADGAAAALRASGAAVP